ncbi:hypothetical protein HMPREF0578_1191 [Mobiluncus mulieris 28-1]|uniref:Uncharacterized protein n=1 Tax=Mobiluncus mulieris ATCC 35239 TaxID=871571 RepID=E0QTZ1_9ACTO|nr:hypothetical protein HMPREF0578_1191 [Mobiluncus mulieris 28-1]EFM44965.1 hypothetical protein HMPREF0580_2356 [Mobiluncus mulieris ATCC 35239]
MRLKITETHPHKNPGFLPAPPKSAQLADRNSDKLTTGIQINWRLDLR